MNSTFIPIVSYTWISYTMGELKTWAIYTSRLLQLPSKTPKSFFYCSLLFSCYPFSCSIVDAVSTSHGSCCRYSYCAGHYNQPFLDKFHIRYCNHPYIISFTYMTWICIVFDMVTQYEFICIIWYSPIWYEETPRDMILYRYLEPWLLLLHIL